MPRPLMQHGVGRLEEMFGSSRGNLQVLRKLENELQYRQVPRALALLEKVQAAMAAIGDVPREPPSRAPTTSPHPAPTPPKQPDLWDKAPAPRPPQVPRPAPPIRAADAPAATKPAAPPAPAMPIEDAYKLLKATAGSTWESIEQTRRQLVQQAHPTRVKSLSPDRRTQVTAEAKRVNAAYAALSQARCSAT